LKITLISLAVLTMLVLVMVVWIARQPPPAAPRVSLIFAGYTNDGSQTRAVFNLTNTGRVTVERSSHYVVFLHNADVPKRSRSVKLDSGYFTNGGTTLPVGGWETWSITRPTNQVPWYLWIWIRTDEPPVRDMVDTVLQALRGAGIRTRYHQPKYAVKSEPIGE
jgi:hypothetical protein